MQIMVYGMHAAEAYGEARCLSVRVSCLLLPPNRITNVTGKTGDLSNLPFVQTKALLPQRADLDSNQLHNLGAV